MKTRSAAVPFIVWVLIFTIVPLGIVVFFAFTDMNGQFTWENTREILSNGSVIGKSLLLGAVSTVLCLIIGYPLAFFISRMTEKRQSTMVLLLMLPMWMSFLLRTFALMTLLENNGLINRFFGLFGVHLNLINNDLSIGIGMVYNFLPYMILPLYSVMTKIDKHVIEAAEDLGANRRNIFTRVIVPLSLPGILSGITMVFIPSVSIFFVTSTLGGGHNALIGDVIDMYFLGATMDQNAGAMLSLVLMVLMLICMAVMNRLGGKEQEDTGLML